MRKLLKIAIPAMIIVMTCHPVEAYAFDMPTGETAMNDDLKRYVEHICEEYEVDPDLIIAMAELESQLDYKAVSSTGCLGLLQISPKWHKESMKRLGVTDLFDPKQNALVAVDFVAWLFKEYKDQTAVLMYYNAGSSDKNGLGAYKRGKVSAYARDITARQIELQRIREENSIKEEQKALYEAQRERERLLRDLRRFTMLYFERLRYTKMFS